MTYTISRLGDLENLTRAVRGGLGVSGGERSYSSHDRIHLALGSTGEFERVRQHVGKLGGIHRETLIRGKANE